MKASELRVNNYYKADIEFPKGSLSAKLGFNEKRVFQLGLHELKVLSIDVINCKCLFEFVEPIPLTKEWLLKFGLLTNMPNKQRFEVGRDCDDFVLDVWSVRFKKNFIKKINQVHELQNLYFALTGKELTIKE